VASSQKIRPNGFDLLVGKVQYLSSFGPRLGLASGYLCDRISVGERMAVSVRKTHFRLPDNDRTDIIMIGPGTGIAPFKAFLEERRASGAKGRNWLFFGSRHRAHDFLLKETLEVYEREGVLHHLDVAFSRDQVEKIYVQHRLKERASELLSWIHNGAHLYLCGKAKPMAQDVERTLLEILSFSTGNNIRKAENELNELKRQRRYQRDVY
jgi:sulfite reductase (NADPH) flavoprotein alpha-component